MSLVDRLRPLARWETLLVLVILGIIAAGATLSPVFLTTRNLPNLTVAMIEVATPALRRVYFVWLVVVCASTVLTHRHHLLDVPTGLVVSMTTPALLRHLVLPGSFPARRLQE